MDVIGFGEAMVLFQSPPGDGLATAPTAEIHVAGAELNVCVGVSRLGLSAGFASRVGDDSLGRRVVSHATRLGVDTSLLTVDPTRPTGVLCRESLPDGARRVYYYRAGSAASALSVADAERVLAARPRVVVVSGITASLGADPLAAVSALAAGCRAAGIQLALDPNLRPALGPVSAQVERLRPLVPYADVLLLGVDEAGPLFGVTAPADVFAASPCPDTVLKAGPDGCYVHTDGAVVHLPSRAVRVVDPVGAGDAFAGGYLAGRIRGATPIAAAEQAQELAAAVVARSGDIGLPDLSGVPGR